MRYRPDIDGLRAVAVIAVLFFHAKLGVAGGFVGVDVFFVISGFLISTIIDREVREGTFTYRRFWVRRLWRLFPAMVVLVICTTAAGHFLLLPHDYRELGQSLVAQTFAISNFYFSKEHGYFAGPSDMKPLLHTWSLSVEEQFYLVMPAVLVVIHRWLRNRATVAIMGLFLVSLGWCLFSTYYRPDSAFFLLPARAWELLIGALTSRLLAERTISKRVASWVSMAGFLAVLGSVFLIDPELPFPGWRAVIPCMGTALIIAGNKDNETAVSKILSHKAMVFVGLISYSLYLWHWPLFAFANYLTPGELPLQTTLVLLVASFALGALSWRFVEQPFRSRARTATPARSFRFAVAAIGLLTAIGLTLHFQAGIRSRFDRETLQLADGRADKSKFRKLHHDLSARELAATPKVFGPEGQSPTVAVIGDSHGDALMPGLVKACEEFSIPMVAFTRSATPPLCFATEAQDRETESFFKAVRDQLGAIPSIRKVVLIARWTGYSEQKLTANRLRKTVEALHDMGKEVWIVRQVPEPKGDVPRYLALANSGTVSVPFIGTTRAQHQRDCEYVDGILREIGFDEQFMINLPSQFFGADDKLLLQADGKALYFDANHLSAFGAKRVSHVFAVLADGN